MLQRRTTYTLQPLALKVVSSSIERKHLKRDKSNVTGLLEGPSHSSITPGSPRALFAMTQSSRNSSRALVGASIAALGAGAFLCARAYTSKARAPSLATRAASSSNGSSTPKNASAAGTNGSTAKPALQTEDSDSKKEACEGCDCGLMEPGPLEGTMHAYDKHVIICSGNEDWPKVIEAEESSLAESLFNMSLGAGLIWTKKAAKEAAAAAEQGIELPKKNQVKVTACVEPSKGPKGTTDVIVYPEGLIYSLKPDDLSMLQHFVNVQLVQGQVAADLKPVPVSYKKMVLVCTHMSRDKRCGRAGPQVIEEMAKELEARGVSDDEIALRGSSHFGGHRFAGVLIIYPQGDWYGMVNKRNAAAIMDKCVLGTEGMKSNWRGNMANPGTKAEPAAKPAPGAKPTPTVVPGAEAVPAKAELEPESAAVKIAAGEKVRRNSFDGA